MRYPFDQIKAVIWDLDETLWRGTLAEGKVELPEQHRETVRLLADAGVVNSVCSKNDPAKAEAELRRFGIRDYFVFLSVDWTAKGPRIARHLEELQLRAANTLFLDDDHLNREEARFHCPAIMVAGPDAIATLADQARMHGIKDGGHSRLEYYRLLEKRAAAKEKFASNEEFLLSSEIRVEIREDCLQEIPRLHELISRTNQLNFTKKRIDLRQLKELLQSRSVHAGYVKVSDRFGDHGIVGFFAEQDGELLHFLFSCRILGMGVERYVYNLLKRPRLRVVGEVVGDISGLDLPKWINQAGLGDPPRHAQRESLPPHSFLLKGPCDMDRIVPYIQSQGGIDTEFTYVSPRSGVAIEGASHTVHIIQSLTLSEEQKRRVIDELPFADEGMFSSQLFQHPYRGVFISILVDAGLGLYRRKTGEFVAFAQARYPLTDPTHWKGYLTGEYHAANCKLTPEFLKDFSDKYEFAGSTTPEQLKENLTFIRARLRPECLLVVLLGSERPYLENTDPAYEDRHLVHRRMNDAVRSLSAADPNILCLDVNHYLDAPNCHTGHFNHFIQPVYYQMAQELAAIISRRDASTGVTARGRGKLRYEQLKQRAKRVLGRE